VNDFDLLKSALQKQRDHILATVEGLSEAELATSLVPSGWNPAGLVQHLALDNERFWFRSVFAGLAVVGADDPDRAWDVAPGGGLATIDRYREECTLADEVIAAHAPNEEPASWPDFFPNWRLSNLYEITLHVVTETACHAGHLDIIRETIDGTQYSVVG
jgi:hypothetical protein